MERDRGKRGYRICWGPHLEFILIITESIRELSLVRLKIISDSPLLTR